MAEVSDEQFHRYVEEGIASLPAWVQGEIVNVAFLVADEPSEEQREELALREEDVLFGLYEGVPRTERGDESPLMPDSITIFKQAILAAYDRVEDVRACVKNTIWHEVAHYMGHGEEWIEAEERKRGKEL